MMDGVEEDERMKKEEEEERKGREKEGGVQVCEKRSHNQARRTKRISELFLFVSPSAEIK
jgi:hypothetical protein